MAERSPLHETTVQSGLAFTEVAGWLMPAHYGDPAAEYQHACEGAVVFDLSHHGKLEVTGKDASAFLHNLCTNDIKRLEPGAWCEAFFTNAKARILASALIQHKVRNDGQLLFWMETAPGLAETLLRHLDRYRVSEDVEFADRTREVALFHVAGPQAATLLTTVAGDRWADVLPSHVRLAVPGCNLVCPRGEAEHFCRSLLEAGARPAGLEAFDVLRVEAGIPAHGSEINEDRLAMEVGRKEAISYAKGCYLGQETIVMARDRGHVNRMLLGLKLADNRTVPQGAKVFRGDDEVGEVTSSVLSPRLGSAIALAYLRRGSQEPGMQLEVETADERRAATVAALPFIPPG